ncbi:hypothetical protein Q5752_001397 [Cryptotrichosporon argae]
MLGPPRSRSPIPPPGSPPRLVSPPSSPARSALLHPLSASASPASPSPSIPWRRLTPVLLFRIADAATYSVLFPFVTDMVTSFGVAPDRIGLCAGAAEGLLMLVEAAMATTWARLADKYGRRPCLLYGFSATLVAAAMMGQSKSVASLLFWRAAFGLNPGAIVARIVAAELSTPLNRAKIFSVFSPSFSVGTMLGTLIGGELARPYGRLPAWLGGRSALLERNPYALPTLTAAALGAVVVTVAWFMLEETRRPAARGSGDRGAAAEKRSSLTSVAAVFRVPHFRVVLLTFCRAFDGIFAVYTYTSVSVGGLGLSISTIGLLYTAGAVLYVLGAPYGIPRVQARFGAVRGLVRTLAAWAVVALSIPVAQATAGAARPVMWAALAVQMFAKEFGYFSWPLCDTLQVNLFDDYPELLATGSAVILIAGSGGRAVGPAISGWLYSISTSYPAGSLGRHMPWLALLGLTIPPVVLVRFIPPDIGKDRAGDKARVADAEADAYEAAPLAGADEGRGSGSDD